MAKSCHINMVNKNVPFSYIWLKKNFKGKSKIENIYNTHKAILGEGMGRTDSNTSILRKEKGNKDSGNDFQDIFLRLKIDLTLGLS